jgi:transposase, IS5 family
MRQKVSKNTQEDLLRTPIEDLITDNHPLVVLSKLIPWESFEKKYQALHSPDMGRPAIPTRLMVGLQYLKYAYNLSDEAVCERWAENPFWQYFCGEKFFEYRQPFDSANLSKWRKKVGEQDIEEFLKATAVAGLEGKFLKTSELKQVNVDTTVQEKNVTFPTDSKLLFRMRERLVALAKEHGVALRQSYVRSARKALIMSSRYFAARQAKRAKKEMRNLRKYLGRVMRDISRKITADTTLEAVFQESLGIAQIVIAQSKDKNYAPKIYSLHAPETECISKGKAHKKYEFGVKVSIAATSKSGFVVACNAHHDKPYDGHTLNDTMIQAARIIGKEVIEHACVDRGYRGHNYKGKASILITGKKVESIRLKKLLKRRSSVEPVIGHLKSCCRMGRNFLLGKAGDKINAILSAAGWNLRLLIGKIRFVPDFLTQFYAFILNFISFIESVFSKSFFCYQS